MIPVHYRHIIVCRDDRADRLVRLSFSLFSLCPIVKLAKPIRKARFSSMTDPIKDIGLVKEVMSEVKERFASIWPRYIALCMIYSE